MAEINNGWVICPVCRNKTKTKVREDTVLINFPVHCPFCKKESVINYGSIRITIPQVQ